MRLSLACVLLAAVVSLSCDQPVSPCEPGDNEYGATLPTASEVQTWAKALPMSVLSGQSTVPAAFAIDESALPTVEAQGTPEQSGYPGSCETWSGGYALGSYTANLTNRQPIKDATHTASAAFLYMQSLKKNGVPCGKGARASDALNYMITNTAPSSATVPYKPCCKTYLEQIDLNVPYKTPLSLGSWSVFDTTDAEGTLTMIKSYVAGSRIVQTTIVVPYGFGPWMSKPPRSIFNAPTSCAGLEKCAPYTSGGQTIACVPSTKTQSHCAQHGVVIVGFDDTFPNPGGSPGAVKIMNSMGDQWGEHGFMWMAYSTFAVIAFGGTVAEPPPADGSVHGITGAFQRLDPASGTPPAVYLVFHVQLESAVLSDTITITGPDGRSAVQQLVQPFRGGDLYLERGDGFSFLPGLYSLHLQGTTGSGSGQVALNAQAQIAPGSGLPKAAAFPATGLTGTNGLPVTVSTVARAATVPVPRH